MLRNGISTTNFRYQVVSWIVKKRQTTVKNSKTCASASEKRYALIICMLEYFIVIFK